MHGNGFSCLNKHTGLTKTGEQKQANKAIGANKNGRTSGCAAHFVLGVLFLTSHSTIYLLGLTLAVVNVVVVVVVVGVVVVVVVFVALVFEDSAKGRRCNFT